MAATLMDVQVCLPGRGCTRYVPGAGQALNAAIAVGPRVIDAVLAVLLVVLVAVPVVAVAVRLQHGAAVAGRGPRAIVGALLVAGGLLAAVPPLLPGTAPVAGVLGLASSLFTGLGFVVLAGLLPPALALLFGVVGGVRLLALPIALLQAVTAGSVGPGPTTVVTMLGGVALVVTALVVAVVGSGCGALRWALLLPIVSSAAAGVRLSLPFAASSWVDLLPPAAIAAVGVLVLTAHAHGPAATTVRLRGAALVGGGAAGLLAVTVVVLLAWPAPSVAAAAGEPHIGPVQVVTASSRLVLPLDAGVQTRSARGEVVRAENALLPRCAAANRVAVQPADLIPAPADDSGVELLGVIGPSRAATVGYWQRLDGSSDSGVPRNEHDGRVLASCVRDARSRLGDDGSPQLVVGRAVADALARADADSRVRRVAAAWSRCMQLRGFVASTPAAVEAGWGENEDEPFPAPVDTRTASATVACESATNLPGVRAAVLAAYEQRWIAAHPGELAVVRAELGTQTRLAEAVLRSSTS